MANIPICIGCGLRVENGILVANTGATNGYETATCTDADLPPITCGDDGILRGLPNTAFKRGQSLANNFNAPKAADAGALEVSLPFNITGPQTVVFDLTTAKLIFDGGVTAASFTNPSQCRSALVIEEFEFDVDINMPAGSTARTVIGGDRMWQHTNTGSSTAIDEGTQTTKVRFSILAPGATYVPDGVTMDVSSGGAGTPSLTRAQYIYRICIVAVG